ncbi:MAG TPA: cytochrome oxidase small assembly protein [Burkholderiaceae bacterium]|nr:cytochrome oxidase small assembly protein [Burkholderiaceae bacterium]HMM51359.1 cytochrome oxidase small assembly protein [Burkholderiaceae bacterium]
MNRRDNLRTALILASIALAFFVGVIVNHWLLAK